MNNKYKRNHNEVGAVFVKTNENGVEYLALKIYPSKLSGLDSEGEVFLKGFLNSGYDPNDELKKSRPKYLLFKSHNTSNGNTKTPHERFE